MIPIYAIRSMRFEWIVNDHRNVYSLKNRDVYDDYINFTAYKMKRRTDQPKHYCISAHDNQNLRSIKGYYNNSVNHALRHVLRNVAFYPIPTLALLHSYMDEQKEPPSGQPFNYPFIKYDRIVQSQDRTLKQALGAILPGIRDAELFDSLRDQYQSILKYERVDTEYLRSVLDLFPQHDGYLPHTIRDNVGGRLVEMFHFFKFLSSNNSTRAAQKAFSTLWERPIYWNQDGYAIEQVSPNDLPSELVATLYHMLQPTSVGKRRGHSAEEMLRMYFGIDLDKLNTNLDVLPKLHAVPEIVIPNGPSVFNNPPF